MRLVIADEHQMFVEALADGLVRRGHEVVGSCYDLDSVVDLVMLYRPDVCVLDADFGGFSALRAAAAVRDLAPEVRFLLLTDAVCEEVWRALDARVVDGVVNKTCDTLVLHRAIERVSTGARVVERFPRLPTQRRSPSGLATLSGREHEVVRLLVCGASTIDMAVELGVSTQTVRSHVQSVLRKLGVNSRSRAVRLAVELGLSPNDSLVARERTLG